MTSYEREYYFNVEKIKESLESIAHSLEIMAETNIKINADIDSEDLFEQEESYIPYPEVEKDDNDLSVRYKNKIKEFPSVHPAIQKVEDSYDNSDYDVDN